VPQPVRASVAEPALRAVWTPATAAGAPVTEAVVSAATGAFGSHVNVTFSGPISTSTAVERMANVTLPPVVVQRMSGTANVVVAGCAAPSDPVVIGPIARRMPCAVATDSRVFDADTDTVAVPAGVSPGLSSPRLIPVCSTEAGTVTFQRWLPSVTGDPATTGDVAVPVASKSSSLRSGVTLLRHVLGYDAMPGVGVLAAVVDVVEPRVVAVVDVEVEEVDVEEVDDVDDVDELEEVDVEEVDDPLPGPAVVNACAGTGLVPVHGTGFGAGPQPDGVGVPGVQLNVTAMIPPGPTSAFVELLPRLSATGTPVEVHVVLGMFAVTLNGVADSSPDVRFAGVGSVIVVVPVTAIGPTVCDGTVAPDASSVSVTSAGMLLEPTVSRLSP